MEGHNNNNNDNNNDNLSGHAPFDPMFSGLEERTPEGKFVPNDPEALERGSLECNFALAPSAPVGEITAVANADILDLELSDGEEKIFDEKEVAAMDREAGHFRYGDKPTPINEKPRCSSPGKTTRTRRNNDKNKTEIYVLSLSLSLSPLSFFYISLFGPSFSFSNLSLSISLSIFSLFCSFLI